MLTNRFLKPFGAALAVALLGELPCLVRTALISARNENFLPTFLGTLLGTVIMMLLAVFLGDELGKHVPQQPLRIVGGIGLIFFGLLILSGKFD